MVTTLFRSFTLTQFFVVLHLLPCFGKGFLPVGLKQCDALDTWNKYLVNHFIDYHAQELLS